MKLSGRTRGVIAVATGGGLIAFAVAVAALRRGPAPDALQVALLGILGGLICVTWVWPLLIYRDGQSEAFNIDEGFFVVMALLLPGYGTVLAFAFAVAVAEAVRRHSRIKAVFNWGQAVTAAGLGIEAMHLLAPATPRLTVAELGAAAAGALVFSAFNTGAMAALVASLGTSWRTALDGTGIRLSLAGSCVALAIVGSLAVSEYHWAVPLAVLPLLILRHVVAGHFQARHDRARMLGLFNAALAANRSLGEGPSIEAIEESARNLLRCPEAIVSSVAPGPSELGAAMVVEGEPSWLVVAGRGRNEPFDAADGTLLEALAAVGAGALTNAHLFREGRLQRERLAAITSSLGEGVCALDRSASVTFVNPAAAAMLGWDDHSVTLPVTPDFLTTPAQEVMRSREIVRRDDAEFQHADGTYLPVAFTASAILDDDQIAGVVIVFHDISSRREAEAAIRTARDQAIEASRLKSQFLANMSHEIRTPMNGVIGLSRMLLETDIDETQRKYLAALRDCGENLMVIINDILDFSKIQAGKLDLEEVNFDLVALLMSVMNSMTVPADDNALALQLEVGPEMPKQVLGDPVRLRQVVTNLVGNAIKFTPEGSVTIAASVPVPGRVRIDVIDTGIGIDPSVRATVLGAFGQADASTTRRYGGTGLGLAICSHLVGMMGGVFDFTSQPGLGSRFWFEVPLQAVAATAPAEAPDPVRADAGAVIVGTDHGGEATGLTRRVILLADDAPVNRMVASIELERLGYDVDVATNGEEAVVAVQQKRYDAVLMDCLMPVMDGYEATRRIRLLDGPASATQIIAMTSSAMVGDRERCLSAGMDDYLSKPVNRTLLVAALQRANQAPADADESALRLMSRR